MSIYSFGRQLSLPDIDEDDMDDEDVGIYLETACFKCQQFAKKTEALNEKVENLQILLSHREHHLKVCKGPFNNYVDKLRGGGGQKNFFVHAQGIKTVHAGGVGVKKWQNSVHVVVE